jgi:hypothetical protein
MNQTEPAGMKKEVKGVTRIVDKGLLAEKVLLCCWEKLNHLFK